MSAPPDPDQHNQSEKARADYLEKERQRLTALINHLTTEINRLTAEVNRLEVTNQGAEIRRLEAQLRLKTTGLNYEKAIRKRYEGEMAEELKRSLAEREKFQRRIRRLEDMLLWLEVDPEWFGEPKAPDAESEEPDAESMELDSEPEEL